VNIKILACQIIGPAAAGSAGPLPTALRNNVAWYEYVYKQQNMSVQCTA